MTDEASNDAVYLRRQMDRELLDSQKIAAQQIVMFSNSVGRLEQQVTGVKDCLMQHAADEAAERADERKLLHDTINQLTAHAVRLSTLEKLYWALAGAVGTLSMSGIGWIIYHISNT